MNTQNMQIVGLAVIIIVKMMKKMHLKLHQ